MKYNLRFNFIQEHAFEIIVYEMPAILSRHQRVDDATVSRDFGSHSYSYVDTTPLTSPVTLVQLSHNTNSEAGTGCATPAGRLVRDCHIT